MARGSQHSPHTLLSPSPSPRLSSYPGLVSFPTSNARLLPLLVLSTPPRTAPLGSSALSTESPPPEPSGEAPIPHPPTSDCPAPAHSARPAPLHHVVNQLLHILRTLLWDPHAYVYSFMSDSLHWSSDGCVCVCVCVYTCSVVSDIVCQSSSGWLCVCVCVHVLSHVRLFALEQWWIGGCVCVYVLSHVQLFALSIGIWGCGCVCMCRVVSNSLCQSSGIWLCVCLCVCVRTQLFLTICT